MHAVKDEFLTVSITSYNYEVYIQDAIESVINQTSNNWRLVIYDNGSTDSSLEIIKSYLSDSRISLVVHKENIGAKKNSIYAVEHAETKYFSILQADDILDTTC